MGSDNKIAIFLSTLSTVIAAAALVYTFIIDGNDLHRGEKKELHEIISKIIDINIIENQASIDKRDIRITDLFAYKRNINSMKRSLALRGDQIARGIPGELSNYDCSVLSEAFMSFHEFDRAEYYYNISANSSGGVCL